MDTRENSGFIGTGNLDVHDGSSVISTSGLTKSYGRFHALKSLDLSVPENSIFGFLGPNGAGKSTAMKMLLGLSHPTSGSGTVFGLDIVKKNFEIRRRVGYLAQDPRYYGHMTARETLRFTAKFFYSGSEAAIERRVEESLELVGLSDRADRRIREFSGGERQRLGLAQAQINSPELLILDEPAASLDPMGRRDVLEIMERLRDERGATIFYSTHILDDVQRVSDAVAILNRGDLLAQAPIDELLATGGSGTTFYELVIESDSIVNPAELRNELLAREWITSVEEERIPGRETQWNIGVTDEAAADDELLKLIAANRNIKVVSYARKRQTLEEAFFGLIEAGK